MCHLCYRQGLQKGEDRMPILPGRSIHAAEQNMRDLCGGVVLARLRIYVHPMRARPTWQDPEDGSCATSFRGQPHCCSERLGTRLVQSVRAGQVQQRRRGSRILSMYSVRRGQVQRGSRRDDRETVQRLPNWEVWPRSGRSDPAGQLYNVSCGKERPRDCASIPRDRVRGLQCRQVVPEQRRNGKLPKIRLCRRKIQRSQPVYCRVPDFVLPHLLKANMPHLPCRQVQLPRHGHVPFVPVK